MHLTPTAKFDCTKPGNWLRYLMILDQHIEDAEDPEEPDEYCAFNLLQYLRCFSAHEKEPDPRVVKWLLRALPKLSYKETERLAKKLTARKGRRIDYEGEAERIKLGALMARLMREEVMTYEDAASTIAEQKSLSDRQVGRCYKQFQWWKEAGSVDDNGEFISTPYP
jgi:hypothetical protein